MANGTLSLFEPKTQTPAAKQDSNFASQRNGILSGRDIEHLIADGIIRLARPLAVQQVQPASLDLRLGERAYRLRASFLPQTGRTVEQCLEKLTLHEIDLIDGAVLETGCVYLVALMERLHLPSDVSAAVNPKSSTGRIDVFTRVITDNGTAFDQIEPGYTGPLYAEISPLTFSILVRPGSRLSQIRFRKGSSPLSDKQLRQLHKEQGLVAGKPLINSGLALSVDLVGRGWEGPIGYRAKRHAGLIDVDQPDQLEVLDYWEPILARKDRTLVLDPDEFYILASREAVRVPPEYAAEMVPYNTEVGEYRVHYAGFFDPGFGYSEDGKGAARAVLEVRSHDVPFILEDGQVVGHLVYERLTGEPETLYGAGTGSNYQCQGLKLSKHFKS